jgi:hypothetical protein
MSEVELSMHVMPWTDGSQVWPDWHGLEWIKSVLAFLAWNGPDWNGLKCLSLRLACLKCFGLTEVEFGLR